MMGRWEISWVAEFGFGRMGLTCRWSWLLLPGCAPARAVLVYSDGRQDVIFLDLNLQDMNENPS